jgi:hypothetical protein
VLNIEERAKETKRWIMFKTAPVVAALFAGYMVSGGIVRAADEAKVEDKDGWTSLFDGKSLNGWKANENPESFKVEEGAIVAQGNRSHLFYTGDDKPFINFEFKAEVMTLPGSNSGYSHPHQVPGRRLAEVWLRVPGQQHTV